MEKTAAVLGTEENLLAVGEFQSLSRRRWLVCRYVFQSRKGLIDEEPLAMMEDKIGDRFTLFCRQLLVRHDLSGNVPRIQILVCVNHQAMVIGSEVSFAVGGV